MILVARSQRPSVNAFQDGQAYASTVRLTIFVNYNIND
jgi:hypothetical protein